MRFLPLLLKNLTRNVVRTLLTTLAVVVLVGIFSVIYSVLIGLASFTADQERNVKLIVTERFRVPSVFERRYIDDIVKPGGALNSQLRGVPGFHAEQYTTWSFVALSLDPEGKDKERILFAVATFPESIPFTTDDLDLDPALLELMRRPPRGKPNTGLLLGEARLRKLGLQVGDQIAPVALNFRDRTARPIEIQYEIVGTLPSSSRWAQLGFMDVEYLDRILKANKHDFDGKVNFAWLVVDDQASALEVSRLIEAHNRDLKCETLSSAVTRALEPLKDILWGIQFIVVPAIVVVMTVIVANAISITARERTKEIAVLKVLGFSRARVLGLVLGEGLLIGLLSGALGGGLTYAGARAASGIPVGDGAPIFVSVHALWWGPALGAVAALLGGFLPSWKACQVKVSQVFARVA